MISIWGSRRSGKTTFVVALYYEVLARRKDNKEWKMFGVDEFSDEFILRGFKLFSEERRFPDLTGITEQRPLLFSLRRPLDHHYDSGSRVGSWLSKTSKYLQRSLGSKVQEDKLELLDHAGEYFTNPALLSTDQGAAYRQALTECEGLICLVDPAREDGETYYFPLLYRNFAMLSRLMNGEGNAGPLPIPVAICVSKADQYPGALKEPRKFLEEHMGPIDFSVFDTFCDDVKFFGTSAIGEGNVMVNEAGYMVPRGAPKPQNVLEPIEWLMSRGASLG